MTVNIFIMYIDMIMHAVGWLNCFNEHLFLARLLKRTSQYKFKQESLQSLYY